MKTRLFLFLVTEKEHGFAILLSGVLLACKTPLLRLFGASDATLPYADAYLGVYLIGTLSVQIALGMNSFISAQGFAKTAMAPYYDQGYYCIVAMPSPESGNTYDLDKVRDGEEMMVVKRRKDLDPGDNSETGLYDGVNITTKVNLKGESLSAYLERQVERAQEG